MNTKRKKQKSAPLPKGYRWLKVGDKRVDGYKFGWRKSGGWLGALWGTRGDKITKADMRIRGPYIAPIRRKRK